ncbi:MAG: 30S ribosomal protein S16 [Planctomycetota bacterium]
MAVRIRMKKMGRKHRPFFRVCAVDGRAPRDGRVIEELGTYDPMVPETDARAILKGERIDYWLSVGAQPSPKVAVLIKKYGTEGSHLQQQNDAIERLGGRRSKAIEEARAAAASTPMPKAEEPAPAEPTETAGEEASEGSEAATATEEASAEAGDSAETASEEKKEDAAE